MSVSSYGILSKMHTIPGPGASTMAGESEHVSIMAEQDQTSTDDLLQQDRLGFGRSYSSSEEAKKQKAKDKAEIKREHEVYKYSAVFNSLQNLADVQSVRIKPDHTLQMFAHLVALKTGCDHCLVTLLDSRAQYVIAEAGRTTPVRTELIDVPLLGTAMMSRSDSICHHMLLPAAVKYTNHVDPESCTSLVINDLSADDRTKHLYFVQGGPSFRFYAAVPLRNPHGVLLGSVLVLSRTMPGNFGSTQIELMDDTSKLVVSHLEDMRIGDNHRRGERMVKGLALFVTGKSSIDDIDALPVPTSKKSVSKSGRPFHTRSRPASTEKLDSATKRRSRVPDRGEDGYSSNDEHQQLKHGNSRSLGKIGGNDGQLAEGTDSGTAEENEPKKPESLLPKSTKTLFDRACNILHQSLEVNIAFFDASVGNFGGYMQSSKQKHPRKPPVRIRRKKAMRTPQEGNDSSAESSTEGTDEDGNRPSTSRSSSSHSSLTRASNTTDTQGICTVLGYNIGGTSSLHDDTAPTKLTGMKETFLQNLLRRYPQGKVFDLENLALITSGDDSAESANEKDLNPTQLADKALGEVDLKPEARAGLERQKTGPPAVEDKPMTQKERRSKRTTAAEISNLRQIFTAARSVMFCPLWDYQRERWLCAGFASSDDPFRVLTNQEDLQYLACFGNSIMSEVSRIDAINSDLAKTSFISSMSHELRSPLHGILASSELLRDTATSNFQRDLISTVDRCGAILLDSINQVLDFTKVNTITKTHSDKAAPARTNPDRMENLLRDVDLSVLLDESMEGIFSGFSHRNLFTETDWVPGRPGKLEETAVHARDSKVFCILDIDYKANWVFHTQPGAWTRIIVNLFGNALKYTDEGFIKVSLRARPSNDQQNNRTALIELVVSDSGQGMSHEFLQSRLFKPFSQENNHASGTGLGLSIVSQLVTALGGSIDVRSERSFGTDFRIFARLPEPARPAAESDPAPLSMAEQVRKRTKGLKLCVVGFQKLNDDADETDASAVAKAKCLLSVESSLAIMGRDWFGMDVKTCRTMEEASGDLVLVYEAEYIAGEEQRKAGSPLTLTVQTPGGPTPVPLIVVCRSRKSYEKHSKENSGALKSSLRSIVELIPLPCGPHKLARVLASCLDRRETAVPAPQDDYFSMPQSPTESDATTTDDEHGGITPRPRELSVRTPEQRMESSAARPIETGAAKSPGLKRVAEDQVVSFQGSEPSESEVSSVADSDVETDGSHMKRPKILLVDDNSINLRLLETGVKRDGYSFTTARNGEEALNAYKKAQGDFDIIFMDINMPIMDGMQATREIRKFEDTENVRKALVVALTGMSSDQSRKDALSVGLNLFLTKPASFQKIRAIIADWITAHN